MIDYELDLTQAACNGKDTAIWFPEVVRGSINDSTNYAKAICNTCPIKQACLTKALADGVTGIWGGTTTHERDKLRKQLRLKVK